jgi:outer membrane protein TolC
MLKSTDFSIGAYRDLLAGNRGRIYPELSLHARYSYGTEFDLIINDRKDYWLMGARLNFPLFVKGTGTNNKRMLQAQLDEVLFKKDAQRLELMGDISIKIDKFLSYISILPIHYDLRNLAKSNLEGESEKYGFNQVSYDGLLELAENLHESEMSLIKNKFGFFKSYIELLNIIGEDYLPTGSPEEQAFFDKIIEYMNN